MGKLIVTKMNVNGKNMVFRGLHNSNRFYKIGFEQSDNVADSVGNIYIGQVRDVVKNINAAFIEYRKDKVGYFSTADENATLFLNSKSGSKLCQGDLVLVQIKKAAVKTKDPVLTSQISLTGKYVVLNISKSGVGFSNKIKDHHFKEEIKKHLSAKLDEVKKETGEEYGIVIRTNAENTDYVVIEKELMNLIARYHDMLNKAKFQTRFSIMHKEDSAHLKMITGAYDNEIDEIVTDDEGIYAEIKEYISSHHLTQYTQKLRLYSDKLLALYKLYNIEGVMKEINSKRVWLKSGAYLVIEPTEAMTVIDVNTGKCIKGKNIRQTILNVNMEAAAEIAYQLSLRNISGIVIIDFISMTESEDKLKLIEAVKQCISKDRIKTDFVEMTRLDLVELTRKKVEAPVYEQIL